jgi:hypothetical protein
MRLNLGRMALVRLSVIHRSILKSWSLRQTRRGSVITAPARAKAAKILFPIARISFVSAPTRLSERKSAPQ